MFLCWIPKQAMLLFYHRKDHGPVLAMRALQGHSCVLVDPVEMGWKLVHPLECPVAFHGTFHRFVQGILREGLIPGGHKHNARSETFFSGREPTGIVSSGSWNLCSKLPGYKFNCEVIVVVDVYRACKAGAVFYLSDGNALLTRHVLDPEYILFVYNANPAATFG